MLAGITVAAKSQRMRCRKSDPLGQELALSKENGVMEMGCWLAICES